jgi:hypothetical protein
MAVCLLKEGGSDILLWAEDPAELDRAWGCVASSSAEDVKKLSTHSLPWWSLHPPLQEAFLERLQLEGCLFWDSSPYHEVLAQWERNTFQKRGAGLGEEASTEGPNSTVGERGGGGKNMRNTRLPNFEIAANDNWSIFPNTEVSMKLIGRLGAGGGSWKTLFGTYLWELFANRVSLNLTIHTFSQIIISMIHPRLIPDWSHIDPRLIPDWSQIHPSFIPDWSQIDPILIP